MIEDQIRAIVREEIANALAQHSPVTENNLSVAQVAKRLGVSESTIRKRIASGSLAARRVGRRVLIKPSDLETITTQHRTPEKDLSAEAFVTASRKAR